MIKNDKIYLLHILESIENIFEFVKWIKEGEFSSNKIVREATIRQLEIIWEVTKNISSDLKQKNSEIPRRNIAWMRDKLIHDYMWVDYFLVWWVVKMSCLSLKKI